MFTGIIHHLGHFKGYRQGKQEIAVEAPSIFSRLKIGESLAVNGVCLSLIRKERHTLFFILSKETIQKTNLGSLQKREKLNLELPLSLSSPLSGHLVTGHVDAQGKVQKILEKKTGKRLTISYPPELKPYFIPQGSVALNGVSLTIVNLGPFSFDVELIHITLKKSNFGDIRRGNAVNIECDMLGKYVYNWMSKKKR